VAASLSERAFVRPVRLTARPSIVHVVQMPNPITYVNHVINVK